MNINEHIEKSFTTCCDYLSDKHLIHKVQKPIINVWSRREANFESIRLHYQLCLFGAEMAGLRGFASYAFVHKTLKEGLVR